MILNERLFENTSSNEDKELSVEGMFKYLKEYPQYNHQYTRPVKYYDLGLSDEQVDEFFEFLNDDQDGLGEFWNQNAYLAQDIYQEGRMGGHLVLDSDILEPMIFDDEQSVSDMVEHNLEDNYYPNNDDGTYDERQQQDAREDVEKEIKDSYITLKDFDDRVNELIDNLKATLDARIENKANNQDLDEDIKKTKSGKWVNVGKEGTHGEFTTKKAAREQQKAMFAQGFKSEALENTKRFKWELFDQNARLIDSESGFASEEEAKQNAIREIDVYDTVLKRHPEYTFRVKEFVENIDLDDDRFDMVDDINESFDPAPIIGMIREFLQEHPFENEAHDTFEDFEEYVASELFNKEVEELTSEESYAISDVWESLNESLYQTDSVSGNKMTFEVSDDGKFIIKDGEKVILNTKVVDVQDTRNQIKSMQDIEVLQENLNENPDDEEKIDPTAGLETVLNDLINDENEAINGYNSAIVNFEVEGRGDLTQVFRDIIKDEQNHIGNLQKVLNEINPDTLKNIQDGQEEAEETLQSDSNLETEETNE